ncbi:hypothetical protein [Bdellovibrio bacteriovorus]|uniref:hypothetical protein n=1 Tax=Bdellovibrio bacteriovorus TaxID=959 RepID=UPI003AA7D2A8
MSTSFVKETWIYASRVREFSLKDWIVYVLWVGMMYGLFAVVTLFIGVGHFNGVQFPAYVYNIPLGIFIFSSAIAFDTIGHRTVYKEFLQTAEALVHHITIFAGITSVLVLCLAYHFPVFLRIPALVLVALSIVYSLIDEGLHWYRYLAQHSDRVEMWSHFFIFVGHLIMILAWWQWYSEGYQGVNETLALGFF